MYRLLAFVLISSMAMSAYSATQSRLLIISPHRKSIQREFVGPFREHYLKAFGEEVQVDWIDQGGTENDLRYIKAKYENDPKTSGLDVFWGGGDLSFNELDDLGLLDRYDPSPGLGYKLPDVVAGLSTRSAKGTWHASAVSSFGIFYNKFLIKYLSLSEPLTWADLADPSYLDNVSIADPRRSTSALMMYMVILYSSPWEEAWKTLSQMAGNTRRFAFSSSDPIKAIVSGDAVASTAIDFYASSKIGQLGKDKLGFVMPERQTILNIDPIAVLKGAPNPLPARRFLDFVLSSRGQRLYILPEGHPQGPRWTSLGRMSINPRAYSAPFQDQAVVPNPLELKPAAFSLSLEKMSTRKQVLSDLIGAVYCDPHQELRAAWKAVVSLKGARPELQELINQSPLAEPDLIKHAETWDDPSYRNRTILLWSDAARLRYRAILSQIERSKAGG